MGSDLVWYKNNSFGGFFPQRVTIEVLGIETPATIFNGKRLEVADLDKDGDQDIVVWCNYNNQSVEAQNLGAGRVAWFENRTIVNPGPVSYTHLDVYKRQQVKNRTCWPSRATSSRHSAAASVRS